MKRATLLRRVRKRLDRPESWTKGALAVDVDGCSVGLPGDPSSPRAVAWCLNGACFAEAPDVLMRTGSVITGANHTKWSRAQRAQLRSLVDLIQSYGFEHSVPFNNAETTTHADVLAVLDEAIATYEATEQQSTS